VTPRPRGGAGATARPYAGTVTATRTPRTKNGTSARATATRAAILEHAARLFAAKGFDGTSFADIAEAAGLTRPAVYHYFASKDDMLAALIAETSESAAEKLAAIHRDKALDNTTKLREITAALVTERLESPERFRMVERSEDSLPEQIGRQHRAARRAVLAQVVGVLREGILSGEFRSCDERLGALSLLGMCNWVAWWYRPGSEISEDAVVAALADNAVAMFVRDQQRTPHPAGPAGAIAILRHDLDNLERLLSPDDRFGDPFRP
jgi:AcrR family transcriptional regulator